MAIFTTHAIVDGLKGLSPLLGPHIECVTGKTLVRFVRCLIQSENLPYPKRNRIGKYGIGARMLVLRRPNAVLILRYADQRLRLHAAMAIARGARTRPAVLASFTGRCCGMLLRLRGLARFYLRHRQQIQG